MTLKISVMRSKDAILADIERALEVVRQGIAMHRGSVETVNFDSVTGVLQVKLGGACAGCPLADMTLKLGVEETVMSLVPEVTEVGSVST